MKMYFATINNEPTFAPVIAATEKQAKDKIKPMKRAILSALKDNIKSFKAEIKKSEDGFKKYMARQEKAIELFSKGLSKEELGDELVKLEVIPNKEFMNKAGLKEINKSIEVSKKGFVVFGKQTSDKIKEVEAEIVKYSSHVEFFVLGK